MNRKEEMELFPENADERRMFDDMAKTLGGSLLVIANAAQVQARCMSIPGASFYETGLIHHNELIKAHNELAALRASAAPEEGERDDSWVLDTARELGAVLTNKYSRDGLWRNLHAEEIVEAIDGFLFIRPGEYKEPALPSDSGKAAQQRVAYDRATHDRMVAARDSGKAVAWRDAVEKIETIVKLAIGDGEYIGKHKKDMTPSDVNELRDGTTAERLKAVRAALAPATEGGTVTHPSANRAGEA